MMSYYLKLAIKGYCMGAADVVPGVSGGTMAFILGIYEELVKSIRSFDLAFIKLLVSGDIRQAVSHVNLRFLVALFSGILLAIVTLSKLISWLLHTHPVFIWAFFFGLVLASVFIVFKRIETWTVPRALAVFFGAVGAYIIVGLVPMQTSNAAWFVFLSGAVAICAMILPGISGSFILVLLGKYQYILDAVNNRDIFTLAVFVLGTGVGILAFSRILNWLLDRYRDLTIAVLCGFMIGSLRKVWPWKALQTNVLPEQLDGAVILAIGLMLSAFVLVLVLEKIGQHTQVS